MGLEDYFEYEFGIINYPRLPWDMSSEDHKEIVHIIHSFNRKHRRYEKGLEIGAIARVDDKYFVIVGPYTDDGVGVTSGGIGLMIVEKNDEAIEISDKLREIISPHFEWYLDDCIKNPYHGIYMSWKRKPSKFLHAIQKGIRRSNERNYNNSEIRRLIDNINTDSRSAKEIEGTTGMSVQRLNLDRKGIPYPIYGLSKDELRRGAFRRQGNFIAGYKKRWQIQLWPPRIYREHSGYPLFIEGLKN